VRAEDLRAGAAKLGATPAEIDGLLERCGFEPADADPRGAVLIE
jgi:hypothetical protein